MTSRKEWLKDLAWFVMKYMSSNTKFCDAFAEQFTDENVKEFDKLTDDLFGKNKS